MQFSYEHLEQCHAVRGSLLKTSRFLDILLHFVPNKFIKTDLRRYRSLFSVVICENIDIFNLPQEVDATWTANLTNIVLKMWNSVERMLRRSIKRDMMFIRTL